VLRRDAAPVLHLVLDAVLPEVEILRLGGPNKGCRSDSEAEPHTAEARGTPPGAAESFADSGYHGYEGEIRRNNASKATIDAI
jgi:hypothetical protein